MEAQKLDPEFKAKWIAALRSGEYKQGAGRLFSAKRNEYCCLGVACHISGYENIESVRAHYGEFIGRAAKNVPTMLIGNNDLVLTLARMNDGERCDKLSFSELADWIEANL